VKLGDLQKPSIATGVLGRAVKVQDLLKISPDLEKAIREKKLVMKAGDTEKQGLHHLAGDAALLEELAEAEAQDDSEHGEPGDSDPDDQALDMWIAAEDRIVDDMEKKEMDDLYTKLSAGKGVALSKQLDKLERTAEQLEISQGLTPEEAALEAMMTSEIPGAHGAHDDCKTYSVLALARVFHDVSPPQCDHCRPLLLMQFGWCMINCQGMSELMFSSFFLCTNSCSLHLTSEPS